MNKGFPNLGTTVVKVLGEVLFVYGLLGWIYGVAIQQTHPGWLSEGLSHLTIWIRVDTFAIVSFLLSIVGFFLWRIVHESTNS